ncbi:hypothetical protein ACG7TL_003117 [Trametes sanguinea]
MSSDWIVVDVDSRVYLENAPSYADPSLAKKGLPLTALSVLRTDELIDDMLQGSFAPQHAAPLFRLPPELLDDILGRLNPTDRYIPAAFLFALTCKLSLALARRRIVRLQQRHYAPLAGHRLVCIGDTPSARPSYPADIFTADEMRTLFPAAAAAADETAPGQQDATSPERTTPPSLYALAKSWQRYEHDPRPLVSPADLRWRRSAVSRMSAADFRRLRALAAPRLPGPDPASWVLCSVSRREYVRAAAVQSPGLPPRKGPGLLAAGDPGVRWEDALVRLLLAAICWPPIPGTRGCAPAQERERRRGMGEQSVAADQGRWAGNGIELTTMARLRAPTEGEKDWTDVTDEVLRGLCCDPVVGRASQALRLAT